MSNARLALQSHDLVSHCCDRYASRTVAASGLYRSRPLIMLRISAGRSEGSSPFMMGDVKIWEKREEKWAVGTSEIEMVGRGGFAVFAVV